MTEHDKYVVRLADRQDAKPLACLISELSRSEGKDSPAIDSGIVADWLGREPPFFEALVAEGGDGDIGGYAAFYLGFSLFKPGPVLWVENLYVRPSARSAGLGLRLMGEIAVEAAKRNCSRVELCVREDNVYAGNFYQKLGFINPGESVRRIEGEKLNKLAQIHWMET